MASSSRTASLPPFHTYSMKQAIEEEFILDVLQNYTTYQSYNKIRDEAGAPEEKEYETKKAHKRIKEYIVANKYQTGFDEPLLHTMYVDKLLADVQAVQALSRLNRANKPHKTDTFVLDFYNKVDDIKEAFEPYYTTTILSRETDVNKLNDLQDDLDKEQLYHRDDVAEFFKHYYAKDADRSRLDPIIDRVAADFEAELDQERQIAFKSNAKSFVRTYSYLAKLLDFNNPYWEMLWLFLKHLIPKLRIEDNEAEENILEAIDLDSYRVTRLGTSKVTLADMGGVVEPIPVKIGGLKPEAEYDTLKNIVTVFNHRFGDIDWGSGVDAK